MNLSPSEQIGLEMTLLRMIAFHPDYKGEEKKNLNPSPNKNSKLKTPLQKDLQSLHQITEHQKKR